MVINHVSDYLALKGSEGRFTRMDEVVEVSDNDIGKHGNNASNHGKSNNAIVLVDAPNGGTCRYWHVKDADIGEKLDVLAHIRGCTTFYHAAGAKELERETVR